MEERAREGEKAEEGPGIKAALRMIDELIRWIHFVEHRCFDAAEDINTRIAEEERNDPAHCKGFLHTLKLIFSRALSDPKDMAEHYARFATLALKALRNESRLEPDKSDRRFKDEMWRTHPFYRSLLQLYLAWEQSLKAWARDQQLSPDDQRRVDFLLSQLVGALSPSNLPLNPAALKRAELTRGESAVAGVREFVDDLLHHGGMPKQILPGAYTLGVDLAATPGAVVFQNEHLELLQYAPQTASVRRRPLLMIPPQINKYYIFELRPTNSMLGHLVEQGFQVFTLSWRNPRAEHRDWGLESYVQATLQAIAVVRSITNSASLGLISACAGGLTALALLGYLAEMRRPIVTNHSLLVTAPLAHNDSILEHFVTPTVMENSRSMSQLDGTLDGRMLARIFAWLRPNDLVWSYWVNNYLLGKKPRPLDVLHWDNDSTRLPAALHSDFIDMTQKRVFERPGQMRLLGRTIDFRRVNVATYFAAGREDYLMPWRGVFRAARHFRGRHKMVLSTSGHIQSILRPPRLANTEFYTHDDFNLSADEWLAKAERREGSWWIHWADWLNSQSGATKKAPRSLGSAEYPPLRPAPGLYVRDSIT